MPHYLGLSLLASVVVTQAVTRDEIMANIPRSNLVYQLNDENYDDFINWNSQVFIAYIDNNHPSINVVVQADMETTAMSLMNEGVDVPVGLVDISTNPIIEARFQRLKPPEFKLFTNANPLQYTQKLNHVQIVDWIKKKIDTSEKIAETSEDLMKAVTGVQTLILYVGPLNIVKYRNFLKVKQSFHKYDDIDFIALDLNNNDYFDFPLLGMPSLEENGYGIRAYKQKNSHFYSDFPLDAKYTPEAITTFVQKNSFYGYFQGDVNEMSNESVLRIFDFEIPILMYFRNVTLDNRQYYDGEVKKAFEKHDQDILFVQSDVNSEIGKRMANLAGVNLFYDQVPIVRIVDPNPGKPIAKKYAFTEDFISAENLSTFINKYLDGEVAQYYPYERNPETKNPSIKSLTALTYNEQVFEAQDMETIVFYWTNGCMKCMKVQHAFLQASRILHKSENIVFTQINMSKNEIELDFPKKEKQGYPVIQFYTKDHRRPPRVYEGNHADYEKIVDFVYSKALTEVVVDLEVLHHDMHVVPEWRRKTTGEPEFVEKEPLIPKKTDKAEKQEEKVYEGFHVTGQELPEEVKAKVQQNQEKTDL